MSSQALLHGGNRDNKDLPGRVKAAAQAAYQRAKEASLGLPLWILGVTSGFWLVIWLADVPQLGTVSPVGALLKIYGTGIAVLMTLAIVAAALWMIVRRLGYGDLFLDRDGDD